MTTVEFIAFTIAFLALVLSFFKRQYDAWQRRQHPERYRAQEEEREAALKNLLQSLGMEAEGEHPSKKKKKPPPAPVSKKQAHRRQPKPQSMTRRTVGREFDFESELEETKDVSTITGRRVDTRVGKKFQKGYGKQIVSLDMRRGEQDDAYRIVTHRPPSRAKALIQGPRSLRDVVIMREILGPPKSLQ